MSNRANEPASYSLCSIGPEILLPALISGALSAGGAVASGAMNKEEAPTPTPQAPPPMPKTASTPVGTKPKSKFGSSFIGGAQAMPQNFGGKTLLGQ